MGLLRVGGKVGPMVGNECPAAAHYREPYLHRSDERPEDIFRISEEN